MFALPVLTSYSLNTWYISPYRTQNTPCRIYYQVRGTRVSARVTADQTVNTSPVPRAPATSSATGRLWRRRSVTEPTRGTMTRRNVPNRRVPRVLRRPRTLQPQLQPQPLLQPQPQPLLQPEPREQVSLMLSLDLI